MLSWLLKKIPAKGGVLCVDREEKILVCWGVEISFAGCGKFSFGAEGDGNLVSCVRIWEKLLIVSGKYRIFVTYKYCAYEMVGRNISCWDAVGGL